MKVGLFVQLNSYMVKWLLTLSLIVSCWLVKAQSKEALYPDADFFKAMQSVYPDFAPSEDSAALHAAIFKYYSITNQIASQADSLNLNEDTNIKKQIEHAKRLIEARILADTYSEKGYPKLTYPEDEVKKIYEENKTLFQKDGYVNYIKGQAFDTSKVMINKVLQILEDYKKKKVESESDVPKQSKDNEFYIAYSADKPFDPQQPFYLLYKDAKVGEIKGPLTVGSSKVFILLTYVKSPVIPPFEEVRKDCEEILREKLMTKYRTELEENARKNFPIVIKKQKTNPASSK